jgi:hypothetical protein
MESLEILNQNVEIARNFTPLTDAEREAIIAKTASFAAGGQFEPFKTTRDYEAEEGRNAHNYPQRFAAD